MRVANKYPVVFFTYKRLSTSSRVLGQILRSHPSKLYIFADGPKGESDRVQINAVRTMIDKKLADSSALPVIKVYRSHNLGLKKNIVTGLNQVFAIEEAAIIVEDDCLPHPSFFSFCNALLSKYKDNLRIGSISGFSHEFKSHYSYSFSQYPQCWGWATWKRAWLKYDENISSWQNPHIRSVLVKKLGGTFCLNAFFWRQVFRLLRQQALDTWDYQLTYLHLASSMLSIVPRVNLVSNIGFGNGATNTKVTTPYANKPIREISFPLRHPDHLSANPHLDRLIIKNHYTSFVSIAGIIITTLIWQIRKH